MTLVLEYWFRTNKINTITEILTSVKLTNFEPFVAFNYFSWNTLNLVNELTPHRTCRSVVNKKSPGTILIQTGDTVPLNDLYISKALRGTCLQTGGMTSVWRQGTRHTATPGSAVAGPLRKWSVAEAQGHGDAGQ